MPVMTHPGLRVWQFVVILGVVSLLLSCGHTRVNPIVQQAVGPLDRIAQRLEEYGSITMSAPVLSRPDPGFAFDLNRSTADYFSDAKNQVQGAAAAFTQVAQGLALGAAVQFDPTQIAAYGERFQQYHADQARFTRKRDLLDAAAEAQYLAAIEVASREADPQKRANFIAEARRKYAEALSGPAEAPQFGSPGIPVVNRKVS
jgi:hypothetical protein